MAEHPREELRRRIAHLLRDDPDGDTAADAVVGMFQTIGEQYTDVDMTTLADRPGQIVRRRWIIAELPRDGGPVQAQ